MAALGPESLPMLERYFLKAVASGNTVEAERLKRQIIEIKGQAAPQRTELDSGIFAGTENEPLYPFLS